MKLRTALPSGLTNKMVERFDPSRMGGAPPIRFVPTTSSYTKKEEGEETDQVKITISSEISKYYDVFKEGNAEDVITLIRTHEGIIADKKLREQHDIVAALLTEKKARLTKLTKKSSRNDSEKEEVTAIELGLKEYKTQMKQLNNEAFDFFEKLLHHNLVSEWREIVKTECESADYVDLKGRKNTSGKKRGKVFASLPPCYYKVMLLVCTQDAAEKMKRYMTTTVRLADVVNIVQQVSRLEAMNIMIPYLPCLKHMEGSPADLPTMNSQFSELEMCTNLISTLPLKMSTAYYASKGQHFPTSIKKLEEDLILVEAQVQRQDKMINEIRSKAGLPVSNRESDGNKKTSMKSSDPIPKKPKKYEAKSLLGKTERPNSKLCQLCAKHAPAVKNTHNTAQCRKFNADGSEQRRAYKKSYSKNTNAHSHDGEDIMEAFSSMRKEMKSLRKQVKRKQKKSSKKRKSYDSSDDSDSDSDSE